MDTANLSQNLSYINCIPIILSLVSIIWNVFSCFLIKKYTKVNLYLREELVSINNKKHWRCEKIYTLSDDLHDLSCKYWLDDLNHGSDQMIELSIKSKIQDLEDHASSLNIDLTREIVSLREHITGGSFESKDRVRIPASHNKFLYIQQNIASVKSKIP